MWVDSKDVLHVGNLDTHLSSATYLKRQTVEAVWDAFVSCWTSLYIGSPEKLWVDQGSAFTSVRFTRGCDAVGTVILHSGVESHSSLESGERYHRPVRRIFIKIRHDAPDIEAEAALRLPIKAMNDICTLVPSLLVFGFPLRLPCTDSQ